MDQMVTGVKPATMAAAADGLPHGDESTEEEEAGQGVQEDGGLTTSTKRSTARRGVDGVDRNRSRRAAAAVDWARTEATAPVVPRRLPARGRGWRRGGAPGGVGLSRGGRRWRRGAVAGGRAGARLGFGLPREEEKIGRAHV